MPNGCSGVQWLVNRLPWRDPVTECCNWHDLAYAMSGIPRAVADEALFYCLNQINPVLASVFFAAVSAFGWMFYKRKKSHESDQ